MKITERKIGRITVLKIDGQAIINNDPEQLSRTVRDRLQSGDRLFILNLGDCARMDSTGLGELVKSQKLIADCEGSMKLARVPPSLRSLFTVTNLEQLLEMYDNEQGAINSFGA